MIAALLAPLRPCFGWETQNHFRNAGLHMINSTSNPVLSIVVPCYNDEHNLPPLTARLTQVCERLGCTHEIIFIDDGSSDATWEVIKQGARDNSRIKGIRFSRNHGHQIAVSAGMRAARGNRILTIDSDLEDPPELLEDMMALMDQGAENVYAVRLSRSGVPIWKRVAYKLFYRTLSFLAGCHIPQDSGDFRLISRRVLDYVNRMPESDRFLRGMISWLGFKCAPVYYHRDPRHSGVSGYTIKKLILIAVDGITSFSIMPLRIATVLGLVMSAVWMIGVIYIIISVFLFGAVVTGWASLMIVVLVIGSVQLIVLGVMGEYLGRMFMEGKHRPLFIQQESVGMDHP